MGRLTAPLLALALGAAAAVALVSCGSGSNAKLLPGNTASQITANLDEVKRLAQSGECVGAEDAAQQVSDQIDALGGVDKTLKQALREGAARLNEVVAECEESSTETVAPASVPTTTESTGAKPAKKPKGPKPPKTTSPATTPTEPTAPTATPTTPTTPTTPAPPTDGGGTGAPSGGVGPGAPTGSG
jgi:septal ring-binding cell division protein DamX